MHLLPVHGSTTGMVEKALSLIAAYENGSVKLWRYRNVEKERSIEGVGWECLWSSKLHVESGEQNLTRSLCLLDTSVNLNVCTTTAAVMATAISLDRSIALSVSADHLVGRYDLKVCASLSHTSISGLLMWSSYLSPRYKS
jgi:hypothetical protein